MAVGWTDDDAVLDQIQDTVNDEIHRARRNVPQGESLLYCEECGEEIPEARRKAMPGVRCWDCSCTRTWREKPFRLLSLTSGNHPERRSLPDFAEKRPVRICFRRREQNPEATLRWSR